MISPKSYCQVLILCQLYNHGGYSEIAYQLALIAKSSSYVCRIIDISSTIDKSKKNKLYHLELMNKDSVITEETIIILADIPERLRCLRVSSFRHVISYSCFETSSIPETWNRCLNIADVVWTCSSFNAFSYKSLGFSGEISVLPLSYDKEFVGNISNKPKHGPINVFYNCSFHLRKDLDQCIYSFVETFSGFNDVQLVISAFGVKSGGSNIAFKSDEEFTEYLYIRAQLLTKKNLDQIPSIKGFYGYVSDVELKKRYDNSHIYFSTERGNGWGIPVMNSIVNGMVPVCIDWGASTEYLKCLDRYLINVDSLEVVFPTLQKKTPWYQGQEWASLNSTNISKCLLNAYNDVKAGSVSQDLVRIKNDILKNFSFETISCNFDSLIKPILENKSNPTVNSNILPASIFKDNPIRLDDKGWLFSEIRKLCSFSGNKLKFDLKDAPVSISEANSKQFCCQPTFSENRSIEQDFFVDKDLNIFNSAGECIQPNFLCSPFINHNINFNDLSHTCFVLSSGATAEISKVLSHFDQVDIFWFGTIQNIPNSLSPFKVRIKDRESLFVLHDKYKQIIILDSVYLAARTNYENIIWIDFSKPVLFLFNRQYFNSHLIKQYENLNERAQLLSHLRQFTKFKYSCPVFTGDNAISSLYVVNRFDLNSDLAEFVLRADHFLKFASSVHLNIGASICLPLDASNFKFLRYYHDFNSLKNLHEYSSLHFNDSHNYKIENRSYSCQGLYLITDIDRLDIQSLKSLVLIPNKLILDTSDYEMRSGFAWSYVEFFCMSNKYRCVMYTESVQAFTKSLGPDLNSSLKESTIYATGPSLSKAYSDEFKPLGLSIICNTIVKDSELLESLKPKYCCAMDSDFHWGASLYCAEFRSDLKSCIQKYETYLFVPFVCLPLVRRLLEGCQSNIIGVHVVDRSINVDLNRSLSVKAVDNVLNVILLPLAASVSKRINLLGFDGRGRNDSKFWSHNQRTQYSELMESIEYCHPAFFICRDYSKYSVGQASNTEKFISHIESNSAKVVSLAPSNVSSINNRYES